MILIRYTAWWMALLALSGCFTVRHAYDGPKVLTSDVSIDGFQLRKVRHFSVHDRQFFWLHGGVPVGEPLNGAALAAHQVGDHDGVVNLRLRDGQDELDALIHIPCLLGILCGSWSTWAEGDVIDLVEVKP
jgi:hypothetical protein